MLLVQGLFWLFAAILVIAALGVIVSRNPVHSAFSLVVCFITSAAIWLLIEAEFLAVVLVLVYVGAVMVLFLFVVMMLDINVESLRSGFTHYAWLGFITAAVVIAEIVGVVTAKNDGHRHHQGRRRRTPEGYSNTTELGLALYTKYAYPFELAAVLLLVAIVAAIALTMRKRPNLEGAGHRRAEQHARARTACASSRWHREGRSWPRTSGPGTGEAAVISLGHLLTLSGILFAISRRGHLPEPQERHPAADVRGAAAARRQLQLRGVLALPGRHQRAGVRVLRSDRRRGGDPPSASPSSSCCSANAGASTSKT